jgi:hypothetical protein
MTYKLETIPGSKSRAALETIVRNQELNNGFTLVSLGVLAVEGGTKNVATFAFAQAAGTLTLTTIDGDLARGDQEDAIGTATGEIVCYGTVLVGGTPKNVLVTRD